MNIINSYRLFRPESDFFKITVNIANDGDSFTFPSRLIAGGNDVVNFDIYWGDGAVDNHTDNAAISHTYATSGTYQIATYGFMPYFSFGTVTTSATRIISIDQWGKTGIRGLQNGFRGCTNLVTVADGLDITECTNAVEELRSVAELFSGCSSLTTVMTTNWKLTGVLDASKMFLGCINMTAIDTTNWDTSTFIKVGQMFDNCRLMTSVGDTSNWDTSNWDSLYRVFYNCYVLNGVDASNWDVSNVTSLLQTFNSNRAMTNFNLTSFTNHQATDARYMFNNCTSLVTVDATGFKATTITKFNYMFGGTSSMTDIVGIEDWVPSNAVDFTAFFSSGTIPTSSYDLVLKNWSAVLPAGSTYFDFRACTYSGEDSDVADARASINTLGWTVRDGGAA